MITEEEFNQLKESISALDTRISDLEDVVSENKKQSDPKKIISKPQTQTQEIEISTEELLHVKNLKFVQDKCLAVLDYVFKNYPSHPSLKPTELKTILREKFAIPITQSAISMALKNYTGTYVTREKVGKSYQYRILQKGQEHITEQIKKLNP